MVRTRLTPNQRLALRTRARAAATPPRVRDRIEMLLLSDQGWPAHRIGSHLGYCTLTVRTVLHTFLDQGEEKTLRIRPPGPPKDAARRERVTAALGVLLDEERTWTAAQLAAALGERGIALSTRQTRKYLQEVAAWRRTKRVLSHKQNAARVRVAALGLQGLKRGRQQAASRSPSWMSAASRPASR
jgi:putative transposase